MVLTRSTLYDIIEKIIFNVVGPGVGGWIWLLYSMRSLVHLSKYRIIFLSLYINDIQIIITG